MNDPYQQSTSQQYDQGHQWAVWDSSQQKDVPVTVPPTGTSAWTWILVIFAILAVIGFLIWYIVWSTRTSNSGTTNAALSITGATFAVASDTSIEATWTSVGDPGDVVVLYVNPTGQTMKFDKSGNPQGSYKRSNQVLVPTTRAVVGGLTTGATYDARLVVTNPKILDQANTGQSQSGIVVSSKISVPLKFGIRAAGQQGYIRYSPVPNPTVVTYTINDSNVNGTLFHQDSDGYICATTQSQQITADTMCDPGSFVLYSKPSTSSVNELGIIKRNDPALVETSAKWKYNAAGKNEWCLSGSSSQCMTYDPNSPFVTLVPSTTGLVPLIPSTGSTTGVAASGSGSTSVTHQPVTVSSQGTRWSNTVFVPLN